MCFCDAFLAVFEHVIAQDSVGTVLHPAGEHQDENLLRKVCGLPLLCSNRRFLLQRQLVGSWVQLVQLLSSISKYRTFTSVHHAARVKHPTLSAQLQGCRMAQARLSVRLSLVD